MKILLDTHVWVWSQESPELLGATAQQLLLDEQTRRFVSPISSLEVARLQWGGKLTVAGRMQTWVDAALQNLLAETAQVTHEVSVEAYRLPDPFHRDPADRLLVATARVLDLSLMTADARILQYSHVQSVDARL